jgi:hypothetical protein
LAAAVFALLTLSFPAWAYDDEVAANNFLRCLVAHAQAGNHDETSLNLSFKKEGMDWIRYACLPLGNSVNNCGVETDVIATQVLTKLGITDAWGNQTDGSGGGVRLGPDKEQANQPRQ